MARVLACDAFLKNAACLFDTAAPAAVLWSANHGDLSDPQTCVALEASTQQLLAQAAVLAEHDVDRPVIGIALDGVGLGFDNTAWSAEVLLMDGSRCERLDHLSPLALPGGDKAAQEPWRMAAALLHCGGQADHIVSRLSPAVGGAAARTIHTMLQRGLNCTPSTTAGRWFDTVAGLLGLSVRQAFEAQATITLEQAATRHLQSLGAAPFNPALWNITPARGSHLLEDFQHA